MYIKKSSAIIILCFITAGALVLGGFILKANSGICAMQNSAKFSYQESIAELAEGLANIDYALQKTLAVKSPTQMVALSAEIWREAGMAEMCLEALPVYELRLENIMKFFHQSGEYALFLAKKAIGDGMMTEEESENLRALSEQAKTLATAMTELEYRIQRENEDLNALTELITYVDTPPDPPRSDDEGQVTAYEYKNPFNKMESEMQMPELNYEGLYSAHMSNISYEFLADKKVITEDVARRRAAYVLDCEPKDLTATGSVTSKDLQLYCFGGRNVNICMTAAEGYPFTFSRSGAVADATLTDEEAVAIAGKFLNKLQFKNMEFIRSTAYGNVLLAEFVYNREGVLCLADKILVGISLDDGKIATFDASEYIKNHVTERSTTPVISSEEAAEKISGALTVSDSRLVIIGTNSYEEPERLCYEFQAKTDDGNSVIVYVNAINGNEEKIDLLYTGDIGSFVLN